MNIEDWEAAALHEIVARIGAEAEARGAEVTGSELVGLMPAGAAAAAAGAMLGIEGFEPSVCSSSACSRADEPRPAIPDERQRDRGCRRRRCRGARIANSGDTNSRPVACAPRWTSEIRPDDPAQDSGRGRSACAAEMRSTYAEPWPTPHSAAPTRAGPNEPAKAKSPYAGR